MPREFQRLYELEQRMRQYVQGGGGAHAI
jgi:hypothetical protein